jgi:twitching motility protein PilT
VHFGDRPLSSDDIFQMVAEIFTERARSDFETLHDADFAYEVPGLARFRVNVFQDRNGTGAVLRQIPIEVLSAEKLGLPKACIDLCYLSKGLVLVTGPTGSGKSTTLAAMIDFINKNRSDHIITIEDPVEFVHKNQKCLVNQREVGQHTKSFKNALRAALREDPDIVLVGEMRDLETISIAIETAETGHLVFGTLHTTTAISTVDRIIDQFPSDRQEQIRVMLSESLKGVIAQILCPKIGGGRVAAHEILLGSNAVAAMIREGKTFQLASVMQTSKGQGMITMNDSLMSLVQQKKVEPKQAYIKAVDKNGLAMMMKNAGINLQL